MLDVISRVTPETSNTKSLFQLPGMNLQPQAWVVATESQQTSSPSFDSQTVRDLGAELVHLACG